MKTQISALMDGELDARETGDVWRALVRDADRQNDWHCYHLIGDALRQEPELVMNVTVVRFGLLLSLAIPPPESVAVFEVKVTSVRLGSLSRFDMTPPFAA